MPITGTSRLAIDSFNPFLLAPEQRLTYWRNFRRSVQDEELQTQLDMVAAYWSKAPIGSLAYDPDDQTRWQKPWELIYNNHWCRSSVAIGMENTLRLAGIETNRLRLRLMTDTFYDVLLVLIVDDTFVLNYDWGSVHSLPLLGHEIIREWRFADRDYIQIKN